MALQAFIVDLAVWAGEVSEAMSCNPAPGACLVAIALEAASSDFQVPQTSTTSPQEDTRSSSKVKFIQLFLGFLSQPAIVYHRSSHILYHP